jgi:ankyrin repeat protein
LKCCGVRIPLWKAAARGHNAVAQTLLVTGEVDPNEKDRSRESPLLKAAVQLFSSSRVAAGGHKTVAQALLETSKVGLNAKDRAGRTPLSWTSAGG